MTVDLEREAGFAHQRLSGADRDRHPWEATGGEHAKRVRGGHLGVTVAMDAPKSHELDAGVREEHDRERIVDPDVHVEDDRRSGHHGITEASGRESRARIAGRILREPASTRPQAETRPCRKIEEKLMISAATSRRPFTKSCV